MSEGGEKTELPTPKRIRDARAKGNVAKSQEVVTTMSLFGVVAFIWGTWGTTMEKLFGLFNEIALLSVGDFSVNSTNAIEIVKRDIMGIMIPILGVVIFAGVAANYFQVGAIFALEAMMPSLEKISPGAGFKRIFSMKQVIETLKSIAKIVFLSVLLYYVVRDAIGAYISSLACGMPCLTNITSEMLFKTLTNSALAFLIVALADFAYQKYTYTKGLMMSKEEIKREYKESEGDPHVKGHRRQIAQELAMGGDSGHAAKKGTAVVVNPTHLAVVLMYRKGEMPLPAVTAKGRNMQAHYLRTQAEEAGVPVFRNVGLARALYADTGVNEYIPDELFDAVAEVLAWVQRHEDELYKGRLNHGVIDMDAGDHRPKASEPAF